MGSNPTPRRCALRFAGVQPARADWLAVRALDSLARRALTAAAALPPGGLPAYERAAARELARGLARRAAAAALRSPAGCSAAELQATERVCTDLTAAADRAARAAPPAGGAPAQWDGGRGPGSETAFPFLGCLRTDGLDLRRLAGEAGRPATLRPMELTAASGPVRDLHDVVRVLRHAVHVCTLLANQAGQVRLLPPAVLWGV